MRLAVGKCCDAQALERCERGGSPRSSVDAVASASGSSTLRITLVESSAGSLGRVADAAPKVQVGAGDRYAVDRDPAGCRVVEAGEQPQQGRLAGAVGSEHREPLARSQVELVDREHLAAAAAVADVAQA